MKKLQRSGIGGRTVASVAVAAIAAVVAGASLASSSGGSRTTDLDGFSNAGHPVFSVSPREAEQLRQAGLEREALRLLGERAGVRIYASKSMSSGTACYLTSRANAVPSEFGMVACAGEGSAFPSNKAPILDFSPLALKAGEANPQVRLLVGIAADGVAAVGTVDAAGAVRAVRVRNNIYAAADVPAAPVQALVALVQRGAEIYRLPLNAPLR